MAGEVGTLYEEHTYKGEVCTLYEEHTYKIIVPIMFDENKIAIETNSTGLISCKKNAPA